MRRARVASVGAMLGIGVAVACLAYIGFVTATRPLHSGETEDLVAAIVVLLAGTVIARVGTLIRRRWRRYYIRREVNVFLISRDRYVIVTFDGVPYWYLV